MAKRLTKWQQTVRCALKNLSAREDAQAWAQLSEQERQAFVTFAAQRCAGDEEKARRFLQEAAAAPERRLGVMGKILLAAAACVLLAAAMSLSYRAMLLWVAGVLAWMLGATLLHARQNRMLRLWQQRDCTGDGTLQALKDMYRVALRWPVAAASKPMLAVYGLGLVLCVVLMAAPEPRLPLERQLRDAVAQAARGETSLETAQTLLQDAPNPAEALSKAWSKTPAGSDDRFLLAALAHQAEQHVPADVLQGWTEAALTATELSALDTPQELAALSTLLAGTDAGGRLAALRHFLTGSMAADTLTAFGTAMRQDGDQAALLDAALEIAAAGQDALAFLRGALAGITWQDAERAIRQAEGEGQQLLIRACAPAITQPDEVLAFLRLARECGVLPSQCYPDGAILAWDASAYDPYLSPTAATLGSRDTFLVVRRTEAPEPFTTLEVEEADQVARYEDLPEMPYVDYDPDADLGAAAYTLLLETAILDTLPLEHIPQSLADCDALVILDTFYACDGYVRTRYDKYVQDKLVTRQRDTPTFACVQMIAVYNAASGQLLYVHKQTSTLSPAMQEENLEGKDVLDWVPAQYYIASPEEGWMRQTYEQFCFALERRGWKLVP